MRMPRCLLLIVFVLAGIRAGADTVKLNDGTVVEGDITTENDTTLSIYLEFSGGTITQTRQINKADIARIIRWTPEQKAQHDFERLQRYQLGSNDSFKVEYYDQIMDGAFRKFLAQYPNSPFASNVTDRLVEWRAERDLVAAGNVKFHGRWSPIEEAAPAIERERGQQLLQQARSLIAQGRFESAIQQLQQVVHMNRQPELVAQAKPLLASACQMAATLLEQQRQQLEGDVSQAFVQTQTAANKARSDRESAQNHLEQVKSQLDVVMQKLTALKSPALAEHVVASTNADQSAASAPAPTSPVIADLPGPLADIITWVKKNYVALAIVGLGLIYVMSRIAKG